MKYYKTKALVSVIIVNFLIMTAINNSLFLDIPVNELNDKTDVVIPVQGLNSFAQEVIIITLLSPADESVIRSSTLVNISVDPIPEAVIYSWDSTDYNYTVDPVDYTAGYFLLTLPGSEGDHHLFVRANNSEGALTGEEWLFFIDDSSVFFTLESPEENGYYQSGTPVVISFDPVTPAAVLYNWDENTPSSVLQTLPQGDGYHALHVKAERQAGGWDEVEYSFYTDDTPARLELSIINNTSVPSRTPFYYISDDDLTQIYFSWDGGVNNSNPVKIPDDSNWHELETVTIDRANNTARYYHCFYATLKIDLITPVLINPSNWYANFTAEPDLRDVNTVDNTTHSVNGHGFINTDTLPVLDFSSATDEVIYNWWINMTMQGSNSTSLTPSPATEGENKLFQVWANDTEGNWATLLINITTDDTSPDIGHLSHLNNSKLVGGTELSFNYTEPLMYEHYSWDGAVNQTIAILPENIGLHELVICTSDWAGNWLRSEYIYYSKILIELDQSSGIINGTILKGGAVITINCTPDPVSTYCSWDGGDSYPSPSPLPVSSGWHVLNVTAIDGDDNGYSVFFRFLTELEITLVDKVNNTAQLPGESITITFSEEPALALYSWDYGTQSSKIDAINVPVIEGEHWLIVDAENSDTQQGSSWFRTYFVFITDASPPQITSETINNASRVNSGIAVNFTFDEEATLEYSWDTQDNTSLPGLVPAGDGWHHLVIVAADDLGNTARYTRSYLVDDTAVEIVLNSPANGSIIAAGSAVNITFSETPVTVYYNLDNSTVNTTSFTILPWGNATRVLMVYASDGLNWIVVRYSFIINDPLATINLESPANGTRMTKTGLQAAINITFSEPVIEVIYRWNDGDNQTVITVPDQDGTHVLHVHVLERSGIWIAQKYVFITDSTAPLLYSVFPDINETINRGEYAEIAFTFDENVTGGYYQWNATGSKNIFPNTGTTAVKFPIPMQEGYFLLYLNVTDDLGNNHGYNIELTVYFGRGLGSQFEVIVTILQVAAIVVVPSLTAGAGYTAYKRFKKQ